MNDFSKFTRATIAVKAMGRPINFAAIIEFYDDDASITPLILELSGRNATDTGPAAHCRALYEALKLVMETAPGVRKVRVISDNPASADAPAWAVDWLAKDGRNSTGQRCAFPRELLAQFVEMTRKVSVLSERVAKGAVPEIRAAEQIAAGYDGGEGIEVWLRQPFKLAA